MYPGAEGALIAAEDNPRSVAAWTRRYPDPPGEGADGGNDVGGRWTRARQQVGAVVGMVTSGALFLFAVPITIVGGSSAGEPSVASPPETEVTALVGPTRASVVVAF
jgi:hypothetical protein